MVEVLNRAIADVSVVVPAYNEEETIAGVILELFRVRKIIPSMEIIVVDDGSSDNTAREASKFSSVRLIEHAENLGKGAALKTGFEAATGRVVIVQDADNEYYPGDIPLIVKPILCGDADVVYGTRFRSKPRGMSSTHLLGNIALSKVACLLYQRNITDVMTGYKAFSNRIVKSIELKEKGFPVEVEITTQVLRNGWKFKEVPISYAYRSNGVSKITNMDGVVSLITLVRQMHVIGTAFDRVSHCLVDREGH
jgi:glycosyltransferase involved in cell wall biosynthesis